MIVVAIIGILAAVAIPMYSNYAIRAKISEVILLASACRTAVTDVYLSGNTAPGAGNWGCEGNTSKYVASVTTDVNGAVEVVAQNIAPDVDGKKTQMTPLIGSAPADSSTDMGKNISGWRCGPATVNGVDVKYLPSSCRG